MGYPPQPHDPYAQSGPHYGPQQPYLPQPYSQPYYAPMSGPYIGPVQYTTVTETAFNPITALVHTFLWLAFHWWVALITLGLWLIVAIPVTFIGWKVTRKIPIQPVQQPYWPPQMPSGY